MSTAPPGPDGSRPETANGLVEHLGRLRVWAGNPSYRRLESLGGQRSAADGQPVTALPPTTTWEILSGRRLPQLPRLDFVEPFVAACLRARRWPEADIEAEVARWRDAWHRLAEPVGERGAGDGPGVGAGAGSARGAEPSVESRVEPPAERNAAPAVEVPAGPAYEVDIRTPGDPTRPRMPRRTVLIVGAAAALTLVALVAGLALSRVGVGSGANAARDSGSSEGGTGGSQRGGGEGGSSASEGGAGADVELVTNGGFAGTVDPWWHNQRIRMSAAAGQLRARVEGGTEDPWDALLGQSGIELHAQRTYRLSFDASASVAHVIQVTVQLGKEPHTATMTRQVAIAPSRRHYEFTFTSTLESRRTQVTLQLGGQDKDYTARFDNVSLVETGQPGRR